MKKSIFIMILFVAACSRQTNPDRAVVLARIGSKTITVNEFIKRSEYAIRPAWCKRDDYISRKVALNNLIAEKILAIEAGKDSLLLSNPEIKEYLTGRKEQAMRRLCMHRFGYEKVHLDSSFVKKVAALSQRVYKVNMFGSSSLKEAHTIKEMLLGKSPTLLASQQKNDSLKSMEATFQSPLPNALIEALFFKKHYKGDVIGPVKLDGRHFAVLRIEGWRRPLMESTEKSRQVYSDVAQRVRQLKGLDIYSAWVSKLMRGKTLIFNKDVFQTVVKAIAPYYFKSDKQRKKAFNKKFWNKDNTEMSVNDLNGLFDRIANKLLFVFAGEKWTVARFEDYQRRHPLVFRNRKMSRGEFADQFRLAIADMLRDKIITEQAYKSGLGNDPMVVREVNIWKDNLLALHQREKILKSVVHDSLNLYMQIKKILDLQLDTLRKKYNDIIFVNTTAFEKVKLTGIDMFAVRQQEPFPVVVPEFPLLTTHNRLDYGHRMEDTR
ncbi:MAG: hypothetical protein D6677_01200 [Calditrichaeota bacterium]|nr:MAG: hypothetical protein D6677_01200 [Calditrichota bacterium]